MRAAIRLIFRMSACLFILGSLGAVAVHAQNADEPDHPPLSTEAGNTGLWHVFSADNQPTGAASFNVWYDRINRNPGWLTISTAGISGSYGVTNWLEIGVAVDLNVHILTRRSDQLSFGQESMGLFGAGTPGAPPYLYQLAPGSTIMPMLRYPATPAGLPNGRAGYYNNYPWAGTNLMGNGLGATTIGIKLNALSETRGDPFGLAFHGYVDIPTHSSPGFLLNRPSQDGGVSEGIDIILSKNVGNMAELDWNAGYRANTIPGNPPYFQVSDEVPLGFALIAPRKTRIQLTGEMTADVFVGEHTPVTTFGARDPVDATLGFRAWITRGLGLSAAYRRPVNQYGGDKNGFVVDLSYGTAKEKAVPMPISLTCSADPAQLMAGGTVNLSAQAVIPGNAVATYAWTANGGAIQGSAAGATATLSTANLAPGSYTASVHASDGPKTVPADCTASFVISAPPPMHPPTVTLSADKTRVQVGEIVRLTAVGQSPDNRQITGYAWSTTGGRVTGTGPNTTFDTSGLAIGPYTISVTATDDRGLTSGPASVTITVVSPPQVAAPMARMLGTCQFGPNSARVDNVCKQELDRDTTSLQSALASDSAAKLVVVGSAGGQDKGGSQLADQRANNIRGYLVNFKGLRDTQVEARRGGNDGSKADISLVPGGASFATGSVENAPVPEACTFDARKSQLTADCKSKLDAAAASLKSDTGSTVVVIGFAERTEGAAILARARAANVRAYLVGKGIARTRITVRPGEIGGDRQNPRNDLRRADFYVVPRGGTIGELTKPVTAAPAKESAQLTGGGHPAALAAVTAPTLGGTSPSAAGRVIVARAE